MNGNSKTGVLLQDRDRKLLSELATMRLIDREQAKLVAGFHSTTRANTRLLALTRAGLLRRYFTGTIDGGRKAVYTLSQQGAASVNTPFRTFNRKPDQTLAGDLFLQHQQHINSVYLAVKYSQAPGAVRFVRWLVFYEQLSKAIPIIPDAYLELEASSIRPMFLEVDLGTEALKFWQRKIAAYLQLAVSGEFTRLFHQQQFRVLVLVNSERRQNNIRSLVAQSTDKIFWLSTFESINRDGFWSNIWLRPRSDQRHSLI